MVEDNSDNRAIYRAILEHSGITVHEATDGEEGLHMARSVLPDVILMDLGIPKLNGFETTRILKADPRTAHIPVLALTVHTTAEDHEAARAAGVDRYLAKPAEPREVVEEIRRWLQQTRPEPRRS